MSGAGPLDGRVAVVTGASSGIGRATAIALAGAGARVAVLARRPERLKEVVAEIEARGGDALALPGDVTDEHEAGRLVEAAAAHYGRLDALVNSAGMTQAGRVEDAVLEDWREVHAVNFWAALYTARAAIPALKVRGGDIVNISSTAGRRAAGATFGPYSTSKFALTALNEGLRQEVGLQGIRVCVVEPGATSTEIAHAIKDPRVREGTAKHLSKAGAMRPEDVAASILFVLTLPAHVNVSQLLVRPTIDVSPM